MAHPGPTAILKPHTPCHTHPQGLCFPATCEHHSWVDVGEWGNLKPHLAAGEADGDNLPLFDFSHLGSWDGEIFSI